MKRLIVTILAAGALMNASAQLFSPEVYAAAPARPNYAVGGTLTGALAGGLIGAGDHHGWEGAGIGAAAGLVVGSIAEIAAQEAGAEMGRGAGRARSSATGVSGLPGRAITCAPGRANCPSVSAGSQSGLGPPDRRRTGGAGRATFLTT